MTNDLLGSKHNYFELFKATSLALSPDLYALYYEINKIT